MLIEVITSLDEYDHLEQDSDGKCHLPKALWEGLYSALECALPDRVKGRVAGAMCSPVLIRNYMGTLTHDSYVSILFQVPIDSDQMVVALHSEYFSKSLHDIGISQAIREYQKLLPAFPFGDVKLGSTVLRKGTSSELSLAFSAAMCMNYLVRHWRHESQEGGSLSMINPSEGDAGTMFVVLPNTAAVLHEEIDEFLKKDTDGKVAHLASF